MCDVYTVSEKFLTEFDTSFTFLHPDILNDIIVDRSNQQTIALKQYPCKHLDTEWNGNI